MTAVIALAVTSINLAIIAISLAIRYLIKVHDENYSSIPTEVKTIGTVNTMTKTATDSLPPGVDHNLVKGIDKYLKWAVERKGGHYEEYVNPDKNEHYTMLIRANGVNDQISVNSHWLFLVGREYPTPMFNLSGSGMTNANILDYFRKSIAYALDRSNVNFVPLAWVAFQRISRGNNMTYVDRDGMNAVMEVGGVPYITGYDDNEDPPLYFLARLPHPVKSHKEGIEALKPKSVKEAEKLGISVLRQGDMFAIATPYKSADLKIMGAEFSTTVREEIKQHVANRMALRHGNVMFTNDGGIRMSCDCASCRKAVDEELYRNYQRGMSLMVTWEGTAVRQDPPTYNGYPIDADGNITIVNEKPRGFYGTGHKADEMAYLPDGRMFARGRIVHDPRGVRGESRNSDHHALTLPGKKWYLVVKNTVPIQDPRIQDPRRR